MTGIDSTEIKNLAEKFEKAGKDISQEKYQASYDIAREMENIVRGRIGASLNDGHGRIAEWQVGQPPGKISYYAKIQPNDEMEGAGAITNYLENGHRIRPMIMGKKSRAKMERVPGRGFYKASEADVLSYAEKRYDELLKSVEQQLQD